MKYNQLEINNNFNKTMEGSREGSKTWEEANGNPNQVKEIKFRPGENLEPMKNEKKEFTEANKKEWIAKLEKLNAEMNSIKGHEKHEAAGRVLTFIAGKSGEIFVEKRIDSNT